MKQKRILLSAFMALVVLCLAAAQPARAADLPDISGSWEGTAFCKVRRWIGLEIQKATDNEFVGQFGYPYFRSPNFRITRQGTVALLSRSGPMKFTQHIEAGAFQFRLSKTFGADQLVIVNNTKYCHGMILFRQPKTAIFGERYQSSFCSKLEAWYRETTKIHDAIADSFSDRGIRYSSMEGAKTYLFAEPRFSKIFKKAFSNLDKSEINIFYARILRCFLFGGDVTDAGRANNLANSVFEPRLLAEWDRIRTADPAKLLDLQEVDIPTMVAPRPSITEAATKKDLFAAELSAALLGSADTFDNLQKILKAWSGRLEFIPPSLLLDIIEILSRPRSAVELAGLSDSLIRTHQLPAGKNAYASIDSLGAFDDADLKPRPNEFLLASHFAVRHFVTKDLSCASPRIRTVALSTIPRSSVEHAFYAAIQAIRQHCGTFEHTFGHFSKIKVDVDLFVGLKPNVQLSLVEGGDVTDSGTAVKIADYKLISNELKVDSIAQKFWENPTSALEFPADLLDRAGEGIKSDILFSLAVDGHWTPARSDIPKSVTQQVLATAYSPYGIYRLAGKAFIDRISQKIADNDIFAMAVRKENPAALDLQFRSDPKNREIFYSSARQFVDRHGLKKYVSVLRLLADRRNFIVFAQLKKASAIGVTSKQIFEKEDTMPDIRKLPPTPQQAAVALNQHFERTNCTEFPFLFDDQSADANRLRLISTLVWRWGENGCEVGIPSNTIGLTIEGVDIGSCRTSGDGFSCSMKAKYRCAGTGVLAADPRAKLVCLQIKGFELVQSKWLFQRQPSSPNSDILIWKIAPDR